MNTPLLNLTGYSTVEMLCFGASAFFWLMVYVVVIRNIHRHQFVALPAFAVPANIAWELYWGYVYRTDMGELFVWGGRLYCPLSCYIGWCVIRHGRHQFQGSLLKKYLIQGLALALAFWLVLLYFMIPALDDKAGISTAFILNAVMSVLYIHLLFSTYEQEGQAGLEKLSFLVGWSKMLGTGFATVVAFLHFEGRSWVLAMGGLIFLIDLLYVLMFRHLRGLARSQAGVPGLEAVRRSGETMTSVPSVPKTRKPRSSMTSRVVSVRLRPSRSAFSHAAVSS